MFEYDLFENKIKPYELFSTYFCDLNLRKDTHNQEKQTKQIYLQTNKSHQVVLPDSVSHVVLRIFSYKNPIMPWELIEGHIDIQSLKERQHKKLPLNGANESKNKSMCKYCFGMNADQFYQ